MLKVVTSVDTAIYGVDLPWLNCLQICRVTNSLVVHVQMVGRGLRKHPAPVGPRPYQDLIEQDVFLDQQPVVIVAPTSAGKSHIVARIVKRLVAEGKRCTYVVKRRMLVNDMCQRLTRDGVPHGVWMPPHKPTDHPVQVASADTLISRKVSTGADVLILDEAHTLMNESGRTIIAAHPGAWIIGMTATPVGVGGVFERIAMGPTMADLMEQGYLSDYQLFAAHPPDFSAAKQSSGDYNQDIAGAIMSTRKIVGDVVETWKQRANDGATLLFASSVAQAKAYCEAFNAAGIPAGHVDGTTPDEERQRLWDELRQGALPKDRAIILDHAGNCLDPLLGRVEDILEWSLDDRPPRRKSDDDPSLHGRHCPTCLLFFRSRINVCPECGTPRIATVHEIKVRKGELEEIQRQRKQAAIEKAISKMDPAEKFAQLQAEGRAKGHAPGWAVMQFKIRFKRWPTKKEKSLTMA